MRNAVFPHFSSSFCSSGENDEVRLPIPNVSVDLHGLNSIGNGFFLDHVSHGLQLGSFTPLSRTMEFAHPLDVMPGGVNGYKTSSMYKDTLHQKKTTSVSPDQDATRNARKRVGGNVGLNPEATIAACKKKKGLHYAENDRQHMQEPSASVVQPMKAPMRRSHKLGDKITALQQLVSPFGKTDTASVLQEATVYIKHLQDQIQVLSNPYFRFKASLHPQGGGLGEEKANLRIRGLCLVPVSTSANVAIEADNINRYTTTGPSSVPRV